MTLRLDKLITVLRVLGIQTSSESAKESADEEKGKEGQQEVTEKGEEVTQETGCKIV